MKLEHFGPNLKFLRKSRKYRQEDIEPIFNIKASTWSNYENGVSEPELATVIDIAKVFDVSIDSLLTTNFKQTEPVIQQSKDSDIWTELRKLKFEIEQLKKHKQPL